METKICKSCNEEQLLEKFQSRKLKSGTIYYKPVCSRCTYSKWRKKNYDKARAHQKVYDKKRRLYFTEKRDNIFQHINQYCCKKCGNSDKRVLHFHHRNEAEKSFSISNLQISLERLKKEAEKCDVLCANCHIIYHWELRHEKK